MSLTTGSDLRESLELIKRTVCKGATDLELELFVRVCERTGLDPFARQIYAVKRWDKDLGQEVMQTQVSIDGLRSLAAETEQTGGQDGPYWCGPDGIWRDVWLSAGPPKAAKVHIFRTTTSDRLFTYTGVATWDSYCQTKRDGSPARMWAQMGPEMLAKCAEALGLRKAFPQRLSGLYTAEEMSQASSDQGKSTQRPPNAVLTPSSPPDEASPILPPPNASEGRTAANPAKAEAESAGIDRVRATVDKALGRLTIQQRASVLGIAQERSIRLPDDVAFSPQDGNQWMEAIVEVRESS